MSQITVIASIKVKSNKIDFVKAELKKLINLTRAEEGCINYNLHQDNDNPTHFMLYETWKSQECLQEHMDNQNLKNFITVTNGDIKEFTINKMTKIF